MSDTSTLVYIIIVTWNSHEQLEYCLPTVVETDYANYKVLIVDNNSEDDTVDFVRNNYPDIELIQNTKNRGYAGGNNDGIRHALDNDAKYIAIINPDIKVDPRWIENAVTITDNSLKAGILGFNVFGEHRDEDPDALQFERAKASWSKLEVSIVPSQEIISGCALFVKADIFRNLGLFDEKYFCYCEESDLEHRVRRAGYEIVRINVPLWHEGEGSSKRIPIKKSYLEMRNSIRYALKNLSPRQILGSLKGIFKISCSRMEPDMSWYNLRRLRQYNIYCNGILLSFAFFWNILHLPQTWYARRRANKKIITTKERILYRR